MFEVTRELARFISDLEFEGIPPDDIDRAKTLMHDFVGIGIRARHTWIAAHTNEFVITHFREVAGTITHINTLSPRVSMVVSVTAYIGKRRVVGIYP